MARSAAALYVEPEVPRWWDWGVIVLTVASLVILVVDMGLDEHTAEATTLRIVDTVICGVFVVDFAFRMAKAQRRWVFFKRNWIDLLGAIPLVGPLHAFRLVRLIRILRFTRIAVLTRRLMRRFDVAMPSQTFGYLGVVAMVVWLLAAFVFYGFESETNPNVRGIDDALWWSMTTLSTVGYGDLYPTTAGGRVIAFATMIVGVGVLGTLAATIATAFLEVRERGKKGIRSYRMDDHLIILGWNEKAARAIDEFRFDPRHEATRIVIIADLPESPVPDPAVRFVRGQPGKIDVLERASARQAAIAIAFARDPKDPRSDHETALVVTALREVNPEVRVSAELVHPDHREFLLRAGCDAVIDDQGLASSLLVRSAQDAGLAEVVETLLSNDEGSELYRVPIADEHVGRSFRDYCVAMLDRDCAVIGLARGRQNLLNPDRAMRVEAGDQAFVVAKEPPAA